MLLRATRADAGSGLTDLGRVAGMLGRIAGRVRHVPLSRVSPLAVPVLLDIGREIGAHRGRRGRSAGRDRGAGGRGDRAGRAEPAADAGRRGAPRQPGDPAAQTGRAEAGRDRRAAPFRRPRPAARSARRGRLAGCRICWQWRTCIWKKARPPPWAAAWCRPGTRAATLDRLAPLMRRWRPRHRGGARRQLPRRRRFRPHGPGRRRPPAGDAAAPRASSGCSATTTATRVPGLDGTVDGVLAPRRARVPPPGRARRRPGTGRPPPPEGPHPHARRHGHAALLRRRRRRA